MEVLSLSVNAISSLADLAACTQLKELYLRKNHIKELSEILYLVNLPHLRILWLSENPCCSAPNYREYILQKLPNLTKLDNTDITEEEREIAMKRSAGMLRPASIGDGDFLSPRSAALVAAQANGGYASPRAAAGNAPRSAFDFGATLDSGRLGTPVASPKRSDYRRDDGAYVRSPPAPQRVYASDDGVIASPRRYAADSYIVESPRGGVYSPTSRARVPPLAFPSSNASSQPATPQQQPRPQTARSPAVSRPLARELHAAVPGETSEEARARQRTDALEEEIRLLRIAEETERNRERNERTHLSSPRRSVHSSPSSPRYSGQSSRSVASSAALSPHSAASAASYTGAGNTSARPLTSNQSYGAPSYRPASARPAAGEKPNPVPAFARGIHAASQEHAGHVSSRPSSSAAAQQETPLSPRSVALHSAPVGMAVPSSVIAGGMTPRSRYGAPPTAASQHNLMCAALAMIEELDLTHLQWLHKATAIKIEAAQKR